MNAAKTRSRAEHRRHGVLRHIITSLTVALLVSVHLPASPRTTGSEDAALTDRLVFDAEQSSVSFALGAVLHTVRGTARLTSGDIGWDPESKSCAGRLVIDARSLETGNARRDRDMHQKVLESETFPTIEFECRSFTGALADDGLPATEFDVDGLFSIHGETHHVTLQMTLERTNGAYSIAGGLEIPYVQWGMKDPSKPILRVAKTVEVELHLIAVRP